MILLIAGGTHTGKTALAQRLLEKYGYPYLSIDHLKMGLIRAGICPLTPESSDEELTAWLWPVVREIIKTNLENDQNLIVEGCYIPFNYRDSFTPAELEKMKYLCIVLSENYIERHYDDILRFADVIERRLTALESSREELCRENRRSLELCQAYGCDYILIDDHYEVNPEL